MLPAHEWNLAHELCLSSRLTHKTHATSENCLTRVDFRRPLAILGSMTLHDYRKAHGLTLEDVAKKVGLSKQGLALIEAGGGCLLSTAARIVAVTGGEVDYRDLVVDPKQAASS